MSQEYSAKIAHASGHLLIVVLYDESGDVVREGAVSAFFATMFEELDALLTKWCRELQIQSCVIPIQVEGASSLDALFDNPETATLDTGD